MTNSFQPIFHDMNNNKRLSLIRLFTGLKFQPNFQKIVSILKLSCKRGIYFQAFGCLWRVGVSLAYWGANGCPFCCAIFSCCPHISAKSPPFYQSNQNFIIWFLGKIFFRPGKTAKKLKMQDVRKMLNKVPKVS